MRFRFSHFGLTSTAALLLIGALTGCGPDNNQSVSYSRIHPREGGEAKTNLLASRNDPLKRLEEDLNRSFDMFAPKSSVDAMPVPHLPPPSTRQVVPNAAAQERQQRRNSWMLADPEEFRKSQLDDLLQSPLDQLKDKKNRLGTDSLFGGIDDTTPGAQARNKKDDPLRRTPGSMLGVNKEEDSDLPGGIKENAQELRKLLGGDKAQSPFAMAQPRSSLSDIFGLNTRPMSEKEIADHKAYLDAYREVLPGGSPPQVADPLNLQGNPFGPSQPATTYAPGMDSYMTSTMQNRTTYGAATSPSESVPTLPDMNANVLNQWNPLYTPATPPEPARVTPPKPNFEAPRRKF